MSDWDEAEAHVPQAPGWDTGGPADSAWQERTLRGLAKGQVVFGRYQLELVLGRGGMGIVWLAADGELGQWVALKFLPEAVMFDPVALEDLRAETRRSLRLTHPNIVRVHDFIRESARPLVAISMEFINGWTLSKLRMEREHRVLEAEELLPWVQQLCVALDYAHGQGMVHRDLKPANLMVDAAGENLKVCDFGIACSLRDSVSRAAGKVPSGGGTLVYMSPQQMMGEDPSASDDVYAVGATIYELLTGKPPFHGGDVRSQIEKKAPVPMAQRRAALGVEGRAIPPEWEMAVAACLAKEAAARPERVGQIVGILEGRSSTRHRSGGAGSQGWPRRLDSVVGIRDEGASTRDVEEEAGEEESGRLAIPGFLGGLLGMLDERNPSEQRGRGLSNEGGARSTRASGAQLGRRSLRGDSFEGGRAGQEMDNGNGMPFCWCPAGEFLMGSPSNEDGRDNDEAQHRVVLTKGFWLGKYPVTQSDYKRLAGSNPSEFGEAGILAPVENVNRSEALMFCRKLTELDRQSGKLPEGWEYRLPTEAQWEYACRAGSTGAYAGDLDEMGWYRANSNRTTHAVGQMCANAWGLHDMYGNVWEWCVDWHGEYPSGSVTDPGGPSVGRRRVSRGGSFDEPAAECRSANRFAVDPGSQFSFLGLRVAAVARR